MKRLRVKGLQFYCDWGRSAVIIKALTGRQKYYYCSFDKYPLGGKNGLLISFIPGTKLLPIKPSISDYPPIAAVEAKSIRKLKRQNRKERNGK